MSDNGSGFDIEKKEPDGGFGIEGIKERSNLVGGKLEITSAFGRGTVVCCKVKIRE